VQNRVTRAKKLTHFFFCSAGWVRVKVRVRVRVKVEVFERREGSTSRPQ